MSSHEVIGELTYSSTKREIRWAIPNKSGIWDSPSFYILNAEWCLRITDKVKDWKSFYLVKQNPSSDYLVTFTLSLRIGYHSGLYQFGPETRFFDKTCTSHGKEKFVSYSDLLSKLHDQGVSSLVIYCHVVETLQSAACQTPLLNSTTIPCRSVENLLLTGRKSDVTIAVHGKEFKAHKLILEAHSPVFAAMFESDMTEKATSFINVEDCDPDTFQSFLQFLYAGKVDDLPVGKIIRLYMISHKYTVTEIMKTCVRCMEEKLNEENVLNILALAKRYNERRLIESAEEFIPQNMHKIISTNSWNTLIQENLLLKED